MVRGLGLDWAHVFALGNIRVGLVCDIFLPLSMGVNYGIESGNKKGMEHDNNF